MAGKTSIICTKCQYQYVVEDKFLGKLLSCPKCQGKFYAQSSKKNMEESIKTSSASAAAKIKIGAPVDHLAKARKKRLIIILIAIPAVLLLAFALWKSHKFSMGSTNDKPDPKLAYSSAVELLRSQSGIENIQDALFSKKYTLSAGDAKTRTFSLRTSVTLLMPNQKKPSENKITVNMKYLGEEQWEYIGYTFDK